MLQKITLMVDFFKLIRAFSFHSSNQEKNIHVLLGVVVKEAAIAAKVGALNAYVGSLRTQLPSFWMEWCILLFSLALATPCFY